MKYPVIDGVEHLPDGRNMTMLTRTPIRKVRSKPRPGRLKGNAMASLRAQVFERDGYRCQHPLPGEAWSGSRHLCLKRVTWDNGHLCHRVSRGAGGQDTKENMFCGCAECHIGKQHAYGPSMTKPCPAKVGQ